jgi:hypothetical protein
MYGKKALPVGKKMGIGIMGIPPVTKRYLEVGMG